MIKKSLVYFIFFTSISIFSQRTSLSPYSFFGVGEEFSPVTVEQAAMGGIGVAYNHYKYLNFTNPAAIANLRYTTYAFGASHKDLNVKSSTSDQSSTLSTFNYVGVGFPVGRRGGFAVGIQPLSSVGYELQNGVVDASGVLQQLSIFKGNGGVNRIYFNAGMKFFDNFSFGVEANFNFGNINNSIIDQRIDVSLGTKYEEVLNVRGSSLKIGAQYEKTTKKKLTILAGATVKLENSLEITGNDYLYSVVLLGAGEIPRDTLATTGVSGALRLPMSTTFGAGIGKRDHWFVSAEYETQNAYQATGFLNNSNSTFRYGNSNRFSLGGFFLPKINSISSYFDRITYRAGFRFENSGLLVDATGSNSNFTAIQDFGISFGLGLPLKQLSTLNVGLEYGKRGSTDNNLIEENYFNVRLSLSLTDVNWFIKRRID